MVKGGKKEAKEKEREIAGDGNGKERESKRDIEKE